MTRTTIDFGIDLGTTNSAIARLDGTDTEIFKNNEGAEVTPSVVWIDRRGSLHVGRQAKERLEQDPENACAEFKLLMGTPTEKNFEGRDRRMKPEELSAEVLKSLKADVAQRLEEDLQAAVITVPAAFELNQTEATNRAAQLAGFVSATLLQEPTAAAQAYGFQSESDNIFWLVYDFGGGTFDAAVVHLRDGEFSVVNHRGDNHLGGKLIDWDIVEQLFIPVLTAEHPLAGFKRGAERWRAALSKLKLAAEKGKIAVSRQDSAEILIDFVCQDDEGRPVEFEYELRRSDVERLTDPYVTQSINLCKRALTERRLGLADIDKVLLVGGTTLAPYVRARLADANEGLGRPLAATVDPLTVVARGAAIVAGTQELDGVGLPEPKSGQFVIQLELPPMGPETEPFMGGKISSASEEELAGFTIEFVNAEAQPQWRSGKIEVAADGAFTTTLWAEKGRANSYLIELRDATGTPRETVPDRLTYTVAVVDTQPPLNQSIGVALAGNEMEVMIERLTPLPARRRCDLRTTVEVRKGEAGDVVRIPVMSGEHARADRNRRIGTLEITAEDVKRDVPVGSEVEVSISIDRSRRLVARAYVPILDEEFENPIQLGTEDVPPAEELKRDADSERQRLDELRERAQETGDAKAREHLERIEGEQMVAVIDRLVSAAKDDPEASIACQMRILDLRAALDDVEDALAWPALVAEAEQIITSARGILEEHGNESDRPELERNEQEVRAAMETHDGDLLRRRVEELRGVAVRILDRANILPVLHFQQLNEQSSEMTDRSRAEQLLAQGNAAMANNDADQLRAVNRELATLLPTPPAPPDLSTVVRDR